MVDFSKTNYRDSEQRLKEMNEDGDWSGITVDPTPITAGQQVTVLYNGLLADSGADQVYLHVGYGRNDHWRQSETMRMMHTGYGWEKTFPVTEDSRMNFCFKDSADNWDNNNGRNWSFEIHNGHRY